MLNGIENIRRPEDNRERIVYLDTRTIEVSNQLFIREIDLELGNYSLNEISEGFRRQPLVKLFEKISAASAKIEKDVGEVYRFYPFSISPEYHEVFLRVLEKTYDSIIIYGVCEAGVSLEDAEHALREYRAQYGFGDRVLLRSDSLQTG